MVKTLNHIENSNLFNIPQHHCQVPTQELYRLNLALESLGEHYGSSTQLRPVLNIIYEDLVRQSFIKNSCKMEELSIIIFKSIGSKISYSEIDMRRLACLDTMHLYRVRDGDASTKMSGVVIILSIEEKLSLISRVVLLLT